MIFRRHRRLREARATLWSMARSITRPCWRRSSGTKPIPAAIDAVGDRGGIVAPLTNTLPASRSSMPKIARATSLRPAPIKPERATISPACTLKEMSVKTPSRVRRSTRNTSAPGSPSVFGYKVLTSRPTMALMMLSTVTLATMSDITDLPSRITVTLWQVVKTSASRWEMKSTAAPSERSVSITSKRRSTSALERAAVGSSMTITRALNESAFAISTICWSATDSPRAKVETSRCTPRRSRTSFTTSFIEFQLMRLHERRGWRPMKTFSATEISGKSVGSW